MKDIHQWVTRYLMYQFQSGVSRPGGAWGVTPPILENFVFFARQFEKFHQKLTKIDENF
jgi:hypothetical protein